jgi:hypothetical protein
VPGLVCGPLPGRDLESVRPVCEPGTGRGPNRSESRPLWLGQSPGLASRDRSARRDTGRSPGSDAGQESSIGLIPVSGQESACGRTGPTRGMGPESTRGMGPESTRGMGPESTRGMGPESTRGMGRE